MTTESSRDTEWKKEYARLDADKVCFIQSLAAAQACIGMGGMAVECSLEWYE